MSIKTKAVAMLLIPFIALSSCSKSGNSTASNPADQFVGTYNGTLKVYSGGTQAATKSVSNYIISKVSANEVGLNSEASPPAIGFVSSATFTSTYTTTASGGATITTTIMASLSGGVLTETGTSKETQGSTTANYTFVANYTKQ